MSITRDIIRAALDDVKTDALVTTQHADDLASELATALDALGYVIKKKPAPRKPAEPVRPLVSQGDPALDEFIRTHHNPNWKPLPLPKGKAFPPSMARGGDKRPTGVVLEEAIELARKNKWPGQYSGNFAAPKTR